MSDDGTIEDLEWENRVLCSDGACIGVIGADGRCKECGKLYEGEQPHVRPVSGHAPDASPCSAAGPIPAAQVPESAIEAVAAIDPDDEWDRRTLCSDEGCIGVIGPDGRCKECGRPLDS